MAEAGSQALERRLDAFARVELAHLPTPLEPLPRLSRELGGPPIWVKRDDATGLALGGNKVRKLEYLMAEVRQEGADGVITVGGVQSNHARQTAAAAARLGLECHLILPRVVPRAGVDYDENGNVLLDRLFGAHVHVVDDEAAAATTLRDLLQEAERRGRRLVVHPAGGSTPIGCLGYARAVGELCAQLRSAEGDAAPGGALARVYVALGSGGTLAGILCGAAACGLEAQIRGVCVLRTAGEQVEEIAKLTAETAALLAVSPAGVDPARLERSLESRQLGEGYGIPTKASLEALRLCARLEGLLLDPVYTSKAMAALVADVRSGELDPRVPVLFWHTGGAPGLFAYREELAAVF